MIYSFSLTLNVVFLIFFFISIIWSGFWLFKKIRSLSRTVMILEDDISSLYELQSELSENYEELEEKIGK